MRVRMMVVAVGAVLAAACSDSKTPTGVGPGQPLAEISDEAHGGAAGFFFLPPMVPNPGPFSGVFDGSRAPEVEICQLQFDESDAAVCAVSLVTFTTTDAPGPGASATVQVGDDHYIVNWHTDLFNLDAAQTYRICVREAGKDLGFADVDVVNSGKELKNVITGEFVALLDGRTLPIKFRIETGATGLDIGACFPSSGGGGGLPT